MFPRSKQLPQEKRAADFVDFTAGIQHYNNSGDDPLSQCLPCFHNDGHKTLLSFVIDKVPNELVCTGCGELATSPRRLECCSSIICHGCACEAGNICPLTHCLKSINEMKYCEHCCFIDDSIDTLSIHCINGCGWYGSISAFSAHRKDDCFLQSDEDRNIMDECVVVQYDRCKLNNDIAKIAGRVSQLQLNELLDYVKHRASTKFRKQMQQLREMTMQLLDTAISKVEEIDKQDQKQKERKAADDLIQKDARTFEELSNSVTTKISGGGNHQTFDYNSWVMIHETTEIYATALFGDTLEEWHCVDIGAGILIGVISGSITSSKMIWTGIEICTNRLRLGAEICKLVETKWRQQSSSTRELKMGFLKADCCQPLNLRG